MKPPNENGGPVSETAALHELPIAKPKADAHGELVNQARHRRRHYFRRHQRTGHPLDFHLATIMQAALVGLLEARRP